MHYFYAVMKINSRYTPNTFYFYLLADHIHPKLR